MVNRYAYVIVQMALILSGEKRKRFKISIASQALAVFYLKEILMFEIIRVVSIEGQKLK